LIPSGKEYTDIFKAAFEDAQFTHFNDVVLLTNGIYCYAIVLLINGKTPAETFKTVSQTVEELGNADLIEWLKESQEEEATSVTPNDGWLKHAITRCFRYLRLAENEELTSDYYTKCIKEVIKGGGDTDTNA